MSLFDTYFSTPLVFKFQVVVFEVRYKPGYHLKVRMGIHLGPCTAGIVGTVLPSYTLFGEGTEIANLMESTGEPMKIQVIINGSISLPTR